MKKVLIVDDEEDMIWSLQKNLPNSKLQIETLTASSGEEALEKLNHTPVDLIVTDIKMPGMSGLDLLSEVNSRYPHLGVIVMTAYSSHDCETEAILRGGLSYIEKPFDINEMRKVISQALQGKDDNIHGDNIRQDTNNFETLEIEIADAGRNANEDRINERPKDVQAILSDNGSIEDSVVDSLLNFSMEDLLTEDDLWDDEMIPTEGRSAEDAIVDNLLGVSEESKSPQTSQEISAPENDGPTATQQVTNATEEDNSPQTSQQTSAPDNNEPTATKQVTSAEEDDPPQTIQQTSTPENDGPKENKWVISTRDDYKPEKNKWVIKTRDNYVPEENIQETSPPENDGPKENKWVISTRDNYKPEKNKWVINTRDDR